MDPSSLQSTTWVIESKGNWACQGRFSKVISRPRSAESYLLTDFTHTDAVIDTDSAEAETKAVKIVDSNNAPQSVPLFIS
jgi:hypothetical protein